MKFAIQVKTRSSLEKISHLVKTGPNLFLAIWVKIHLSDLIACKTSKQRESKMLAEVFEILGENSPLVDIFILYPKSCCYFKYLAGTQSKIREIVR